MICVANVNEGAYFIIDPLSMESGRLLWRWLLPL